MFGFGKKRNLVCSPANGELINVTQVEDPVFAGEMMGKGFAVKPLDNEVYSPVSGEVVLVADTKHAIGIKTKDGTEVIVHVGIDTVKLDGKGFEVFVKVGDNIKTSDKLMTVDFDLVKETGYKTDIIVVFGTNEKLKIKEYDKDVKAKDEVGTY